MAPFLGKIAGARLTVMRFGGSPSPDRVQRAAHALAAFGDGLVGKADNGEGRHARPDLHLDVDGAGFDALERDRRDPREHAQTPPLAQPAL